MPSHRAPFWCRICSSPLPVLALIALAGNTDALVMMHGKQLLAVYMTGDSTRISAALLQGAWDKVGALLCVVVSFLAGTTLAAWIGERAGAWRAAIALMLTGLLIAFAIPYAGDDWPLRATSLIAAAMGALNQTRADQSGVTFITGALIKVGRHLAAGRYGDAALGMARWAAWLAGAVVGAMLDSHFGSGALFALVLFAFAGALAAVLTRMSADPPADSSRSSL
ncbi:DUF1275 family protein [Paraburkholderia acidisoli]|uniref:DUF1275 domain-containing protein n=1 Tax=Paraburkholderia acidisoli TaxID=2571748 RepID=A0A7Z2GSU3_9BURK|nr:YoaK family protein [Paraburkholderia acidisoli]QGZ67064.1 DUF1275 domain-containing protein [Paraburkholderia acidisoli]